MMNHGNRDSVPQSVFLTYTAAGFARRGTSRLQIFADDLDWLWNLMVMEETTSPNADAATIYGRACATCARAKVKCIVDDSSGAKCER